MLADADRDDTDIFSNPSGPSSGAVAQLTDDGEMPGAVPSPEDVITVPLSQMCVKQDGNGDSLSFVQSLPDASIDHIITDWPYAIDMDNIDQANAQASVASTVDQHDVARNKNLQELFIHEAYRLLKPGGFFITWTDISVWQLNFDRAKSVGFSVQSWPLIWHKTHRCMNQMALYNFTKDYEIAIVCRKGNANLLTTQATSIYMGATDQRTRDLQHPFAKPAKLWQWLYSAVAHKGQLVLDPFAGCGSSTLAAIEHGLQPLAVECNENHYAQLVVNVSEHYKRNLKNVKFV
jgi:site-specific DNA-methyltransferase (adenine-specific)